MTREQAIEIVKTQYPHDHVMKTALGLLIPELRESEDEWIPKELIEYLKQKEDYRSCWIAWLEKQKEQKPVEYLDKDKVYAIMKKLHDLSFSQNILINSKEYKQIDEITHAIRLLLDYPIEQKPAEKQDYSGLTDLERAIHWGFLSAGVENAPVTIIKDTAQECLAQMKPAWSDEDERNRDRAIFYTRFYQRNQGTTKGSEECIDWLKSLKPQSKAEWSEEDELCFDSFSALMNLLDDDIPEKEPVIKWVKQLKNRFSNSDPRSVGLHYILKSRPHWKPSEEQIQALEYVVSSIPPNYLKEQEHMMTLIGQVLQQLKKL